MIMMNSVYLCFIKVIIFLLQKKSWFQRVRPTLCEESTPETSLVCSLNIDNYPVIPMTIVFVSQIVFLKILLYV